MNVIKRIHSIQALRALAAVMVVIFHARGMAYIYQNRYGIQQTQFFDFAFLEHFGAFGVDIFFVISGFVMTFITWDTPRQLASVSHFIKRRLIRIVPIYWVFTIFLSCIFIFNFNSAAYNINFSDIILSLFFFPYISSNGSAGPILAVGWSLNYEIFFYFLFSIGFLFKRNVFIYLIGSFFSISVIIGLFFRFENQFLIMITNTLVLEFYFGILICVFLKKIGNIPNLVGWVTLFIALMMIYLLQHYAILVPSFRGIFWGIPAACIFIWFLSLEKERSFLSQYLFQALGSSSYSLYLSHFIVLPIIGRTFGFMGILKYFNMDFYILFTVIISVFIGHIIHLFLEIPLTSFCERFFIKNR